MKTTSGKIPKIKPLPSTGARRYEQAHFVWIALAGWTQHRVGKTLTYGELAKLLGYGAQAGHTLSKALGMISLYCRYNDLPPLSCIVVAKNSNTPGWEGMVPKGSSLTKEQKRVWKTQWHLFRTPSPGTFRRVQEELVWEDFI